MKQHIANFPRYLLEGYEIGQQVQLDIDRNNFDTILFIGMGGSAMTLSIMQVILENSRQAKPSAVIRDYDIPQWVNEKTLMIVASYSGNTEETISAMKKGLATGAHMIALTSGGILQEFARADEYTLAEMPTGIEPRAALPYSFGIQLALFERFGCIKESVQSTLERTQNWSMDKHQQIHEEAKTIATAIANKIPAIYTTQEFSPLALRTRQQINENSRMLCRDNIIPEFNHNELLGRQEKNEHIAVLRLEDPDMYIRNMKRFELTKKVLKERGVSMYTIIMAGETYLQKTCSTIYRIDRLSYYLAMERGVDPSGMELIEWLKGELKQFVSQ